jgi:hypothetical protein
MSATTLGGRLDLRARRMAARPLPALPWAGPFAVLLNHLAALPTPDARFTRTELTGAEAETERPRRQAMWPGQAEPGVPGEPLPSDVVARLRTVVGPGVETIRVHDGDAADEAARTHRADAVTVGSEVFFRQGRFKPRDPAGFALLVHEATHVVERFRPGASWRRATTGAAAAEEQRALAGELSVLPGWAPGPAVDRYLLAPTAQQPMPSAPQATPSAHTAAPAARPMTAAVDRPTAPAGRPQPALDVEALRGRIMRDLMRQLRDEFERGG